MADALAVLVVDDDPEILTLMVDMLGEQFTTRGASGTDEAVTQLEQHPTDVLLSDVRMPGRNGLWLAGYVSERWPATGIVLMSGYSSAFDELEGTSWRLLRKPSHLEDIVAAVRKAAKPRQK